MAATAEEVHETASRALKPKPGRATARCAGLDSRIESEGGIITPLSAMKAGPRFQTTTVSNAGGAVSPARLQLFILPPESVVIDGGSTTRQ